MKTTAAVLRESGLAAPYAQSLPLSLVELDLDDPGPGELLVRIEAAGLCHSDLSVIDGSRLRPVPMALGHEAAGIVLDVGPGVFDVALGDQVVMVFVPSCGSCAPCAGGQPALCEPGARANTAGELLQGGWRLRDQTGTPVNHHLGVSGFATHAVVDRGSAVVVPSDVPPAVAALFGCALLTGVGAVQETAVVRPGQSVAVFGLGGVGMAAVLGAVVAGAHPIVVVDPVASKRALALELGATHAIDPAAGEAVRDLVARGVDIAVECVGRASVLQQAWTATARGGTTVAVGLPDPSETFSIPAVQLVGEARTLVGSYMGSSAPQRDIPRLVELWRAGRLPVEKLAAPALPLSEINAGFDLLAAGTVVRQVILP